MNSTFMALTIAGCIFSGRPRRSGSARLLPGHHLNKETQGQDLARAQQIVGDLSQTRWLLIEQEQNQLPLPLLFILVFWLALLFVSFGLFSPPNVTALTVLLVGACAVSAAIFLVLKLNQPLEGFIKISNARNALRHLDP